MVIIGVIGKLCAGKNLFADVCNKEFQTETVIMEDVLNMEEIINKLFHNKDEIVVRRK